MVFHWSLSDSKSPQVSRTRLRILAVLSHAVVWIVSTRPPTSKSSRPFDNPLVIVPNAPIITGTIVTFMFHSFFNSLARSRYLSFTFLQIYSVVCRDSKVVNFADSLFFGWFLVLHASVTWWFPLEFEWLRMSSSLQDSSYYSDRLINAVFWMTTSWTLISMFASSYTNILVTLLSVPVTTGITVTFM